MKRIILSAMLVLLAVAVLGAGICSAAVSGQPEESKAKAQTGSKLIFYKNGDADGDGKITILDATMVQRVLAALTRDTDGMIKLRGDVDKNGLTILDATSIQRYLAEYQDKHRIGSDISVMIDDGSVELPGDLL